MKVLEKVQESKEMDTKKRKLIDNPLLQSTLKSSPQKLMTPAVAPKKTIHPSFKPTKDSPKYIMSPDEEKVSVFEIISDLEKQLDTAFSLKDSQEKEILHLKEKLQATEEKAGMSEAKLKELKGLLVSQEELNSELEFLENDRLDTVGKIKSMEETLEGRDAVIKYLENKINILKEIQNSNFNQITINSQKLGFDDNFKLFLLLINTSNIIVSNGIVWIQLKSPLIDFKSL